MTMAYHRYHRIDTKIVRIFNTYGPRMRLRDGRVVPAFIGQALAGKSLTVFGDGSQTRSFCYVDRKSTRLNSSHSQISYAVFCLKKKKRHKPTVARVLL